MTSLEIWSCVSLCAITIAVIIAILSAVVIQVYFQIKREHIKTILDNVAEALEEVRKKSEKIFNN